ncbi:meso-2,3-butanediol dehydrogenase-like [Maniola hyperantus]|uniref:meso-2,3-butanediol dehydrogenase-like n=1 Tax=Aphantopus hyperantus TaxID=2795564 RepID=UPI00374A3363
MSFENKVVVITGAGSGIGEAIAVHFAKLSAKLSLLDINAENLEKAIKKCEKLSKTKAIKIVLDMTKDESVKQAVDKTIDELEKIDVVVNCAGIISVSGILDGKFINDFDNVMAINFRAYVIMSHYSAPALVKTKGCIINIASVCAKLVDKKIIPYTTSKAAVVQFTKNAALELAEKGVRVNSISPGYVKTNIATNSLSQEDLKLMNSKSAPLEHVLKVDEIADLAGYLASDKAQSITGADFVIDSGYSLLGLLLDD